ncbi:MAG: hypothetical protein GF329_13190 [Candidatus Lokiarchaeota archaeon]|nr:hypothetical protein [Candidatus Lokiarchaeota archaeon]
MKGNKLFFVLVLSILLLTPIVSVLILFPELELQFGLNEKTNSYEELKTKEIQNITDSVDSVLSGSSKISKKYNLNFTNYKNAKNVTINPEKINLNETAIEDCQNNLGYYISKEIELDLESEYQYNYFKIEAANLSYSEDIDQEYNLNDTSLSFGGIPPNLTAITQGFTPAQSNYVKIEVYLSKFGNPTDEVMMNLYEWGGPAGPIGPSLASDTIPASQITNNPLHIPVNFTIEKCLNLSKNYCFVLNRTGALNSTHYYSVKADLTAGYTGGYVLLNYGSGWNIESTMDLRFRTFYSIDAKMDFGYRYSADNSTWSSWYFNNNTQSSDFTRHNHTFNVNENLSRYLQIYFNLISNNPDYLPTIYSTTFNYTSYIFNYSFLEIDIFNYSMAENLDTINISVDIETNISLDESDIKIYDFSEGQWVLLHPGFENIDISFSHTTNITKYLNNTLKILLMGNKSVFPFRIDKNITLKFFETPPTTTNPIPIDSSILIIVISSIVCIYGLSKNNKFNRKK